MVCVPIARIYIDPNLKGALQHAHDRLDQLLSERCQAHNLLEWTKKRSDEKCVVLKIQNRKSEQRRNRASPITGTASPSNGYKEPNKLGQIRPQGEAKSTMAADTAPTA